MIVTVFTAAAVYVATGIDYLVILILLFSQIKKRNQIKYIWIGQYIGTVIIILPSLLVSLGVANLVPQQCIIGLLGLLPLYLGIKIWIQGRTEERRRGTEGVVKYELDALEDI